MKHDLPSIEQSKRTFRRQLADRPIAEKLRMLDALRERTLAIRRASDSSPKKKAIVQEKHLRQRTKSPWRPSPDNQ
jgi:hypothetical protein